MLASVWLNEQLVHFVEVESKVASLQWKL